MRRTILAGRCPHNLHMNSGKASVTLWIVLGWIQSRRARHDTRNVTELTGFHGRYISLTGDQHPFAVTWAAALPLQLSLCSGTAAVAVMCVAVSCSCSTVSCVCISVMLAGLGWLQT